MSEQELDLSAYLGGDKGPYTSWDAVNSAMIRHWCEAMGDDNPLYSDQAAAQAAGFGDVVAPPTMLQAWTMRGLREQHPPGSDQRNPFEVLEVLEQAGFPAVVAVNCEQEYLQYLELGDSVYYRSTIETLSEQKTTALGVGFFITELSSYFNQRDELVGTMRFRVFKYRPHEAQAGTGATPGPDKPQAAQRMRPVRNYDTDFFWEGIDNNELRIQRCSDCQTLRHPPAPVCPQCQCMAWDSITASGRGTLYSYVVMHHPQIPPFDYPNLIGLVELEEGTRLVSNLVGVQRSQLAIGMPLQVSFDEVEDGLRLHQFRPVEAS